MALAVPLVALALAARRSAKLVKKPRTQSSSGFFITFRSLSRTKAWNSVFALSKLLVRSRPSV
eukprot:12924813-Prorocentrum_lima.AAC.1